jgi:hypothetical protein
MIAKQIPIGTRTMSAEPFGAAEPPEEAIGAMLARL